MQLTLGKRKLLQYQEIQTGTWLTTNGTGMYFGWSLGSGTNFHTTTTDAFQSAGFKMAKSDQVNLQELAAQHGK